MSMRVSTTSVQLAKGVTLVGRSRAGDGTSFAIPEWKWLFDCGVPTSFRPHHIFLTHTHADHVTFLWQYLNSNSSNDKNDKTTLPTLYVPAEALPFVEAYLRAHQALVELSNDSRSSTLQQQEEKEMPYHVRPVSPGQEFTVRQKGGDEYVVIPILADHRITCYGYSIYRLKKSLKQEYIHMKGHEIGQLRKKGISVYDASTREPLFCYIGDTTHRVLETNPDILFLMKNRVIVTECSFLTNKDLDRAEETKHTNWIHLKPIVEAHPKILFVLIHFSLKHSSLSLLDFFNSETSQHRNVHPMLVQDEIQNEWNRQQQQGQKQKQRNDDPYSTRPPPPPPTCGCFQCVPPSLS